MSLAQYARDKCVLTWNKGGPIYQRNGDRFSWVTELRLLTLNPECMAEVVRVFLDAHAAFGSFQLAGVETAGIGIVSAIQQGALARGLTINALTVRKKRKKHLQQNHIDGASDGSPVVVVDDTYNSGSSVANAVVKLRAAGHVVAHAFVILDYKSKLGIATSLEHKLRVLSILKLQDVDVRFSHPHIPKLHHDTLWTFTSPDAHLGFCVPKSTPVLHEGRLLFGSDVGTFWCLDAATGDVLWSKATPDRTRKGVISSPVRVGDDVIYGNYSGHLIRLNIKTGDVVWDVKECDWIGSSPCVHAGRVFIGLEFSSPPSPYGGALGCFDLETGALLWSKPCKTQLHGSPITAEERGLVVIGTNDGLVGVYTPEGDVIHETGGFKAIKYHAAIYKDMIVFGAFDGCAYVMELMTGDILFSYQTDDLLYMRPLIVGNRAYLGSSDHQFIVIDLDTLSLVAAFDVGEKVHSSPALIDGVVLVGTSKGELLGFDPITLDEVVHLQFPERLLSMPVAGPDGVVYLYDVTNTMHAIRIEGSDVRT